MWRLSVPMVAIVFLFAIRGFSGAEDCYECILQASQPPIPSGGETGGKHREISDTEKQPSADDKRGTPDFPIVIKMLDPPDAKTKAAQDAEDRKARAAKEGWDWLFNFLLVLVGIGQGGVLFYTALVSNRSAKAAEAAAGAVVSQLRAYVSMRIKDGMPPRFDSVSGPWIAFDLRNTGQSPAFEMTHWIHNAIGPLDFKGPFLDGSKDVAPQKHTLAPGTEINIVSQGPEPRPGDLAAFIDGRSAVYVWGEINFVDAFKNARFHKFRYLYTIENVRDGVQGARFCEEGNEAN